MLVFWNNIRRKVNADFIVDELVRLLCVDLLELSDQVARLFDKRSLWHLCQFEMQLVVEFFKLLYLILHALPLGPKGEQLVLELRIKLMLDILIEVLDLFALLFFCFRHFLDRRLDILRVFRQFFEPLLQTNRFLSYDFTMLFVNFLKSQELVILV